MAHATAHHQSGELSHANPDEARRCRTQRSPAPHRRRPGKRCPGSHAADTNPNGQDNHFDLQAHRGGIGLTVESTLASFAKAIETGVSTLELDLQITKDGHEVITHDRKISGQKCLDTAPVTPNDPQFPYVGKYVKDLTFAQVRSLDCGSLTLPQFPGQAASPGAKMPTLAEVFALADSHRASQVKFNIETKVEAGAPAGNRAARAVRRRRAPRNQGRPHAEPGLNPELRLGLVAPGPAARSRRSAPWP